MELNPTQALGDPDSLVLFEQKSGKQTRKPYPVLHATINIIIYPSLNREGRWGTTYDFTTSFLHFSLFSTAFWDLPNSRPVHSPMWPSHLFFCLPCLLPPFIVHCKMVAARPDEQHPGDLIIPVQFASHYNGQEVFQWFDCRLDLDTDFLVGNMVLLRPLKKTNQS